MPCCGKSFTSRRPADQGRAVTSGPEPVRAEAQRVAAVRFFHESNRAITAMGSATHRRYRFGAGSVLEVDGRDAPSIAGVPGLRRLADGA